MKTETIEYFAGQTKCIGKLMLPDNATAPVPVILIAHTWRGLDHFPIEKAKELTALGYAAFAIDLYGMGAFAKNDQVAAALMAPLFQIRALLAERIVGAYETAKKFAAVDSSKIAAIGFCFGGLAVLELLKSQAGKEANLKGVVSIHGVLGDTIGPFKAVTKPILPPISSKLLVLHGYKDPLVPIDDLLNLQKEMSAAGVNWQVNIYSNVGHAFTNPEAHDKEAGMFFDPETNARCSEALRDFFKEIFK